MYLLYSALLAAGLLISLPYWMFGKRRHGKYREGLRERLGQSPVAPAQISRAAIWIHAVSVGEVLAVGELVAELRRRFPQYRGGGFNHYCDRPEAGEKAFRRGKRLLLSLGLRFRHPPYLTTLKPRTGRDR